MTNSAAVRDASEATLHLVVRQANGLYHAIVGGLGCRAAVRTWFKVPRPAAVMTGQVVVVDLADPAEDLRPKELIPILNHADVWLVLGSRPVDPAWLEVVQYPRVNVVTNPQSLVIELIKRVQGPSWQSIAGLVLEHEPVLRTLQAYVLAICANPWRIRRPRDLAACAGECLRDVRARCRAYGFTRVEHFIVCVRAIALQQVRSTLGVPSAVARPLVGFQDLSNMRRHLGRALSRSPQAAHRLHSLLPALDLH